MAKFSSVTYAVVKAQGVPVLQFLNWGYKWHCQRLSFISPVQIKPRKPEWQRLICKGREMCHQVVRHKQNTGWSSRAHTRDKSRIPKQIITSVVPPHSARPKWCPAGLCGLCSPAQPLLPTLRLRNPNSSCTSTPGMAQPPPAPSTPAHSCLHHSRAERFSYSTVKQTTVHWFWIDTTWKLQLQQLQLLRRNMNSSHGP